MNIMAVISDEVEERGLASIYFLQVSLSCHSVSSVKFGGWDSFSFTFQHPGIGSNPG